MNLHTKAPPSTNYYQLPMCFLLNASKQQPYHTHAHTNPNPSAPRAACITLGFQGQRYLNDIFEKDLRCQAIRHHPNGLRRESRHNLEASNA